MYRYISCDSRSQFDSLHRTHLLTWLLFLFSHTLFLFSPPLLQLRCIEAHKAAHLYYFYTQNPGRTLIFCNAISVVQSLTDLLNMLKVPAFPLHGKMQQRQRLKNLDRFVADANGVIVATDVAARGLDVRHASFASFASPV